MDFDFSKNHTELLVMEKAVALAPVNPLAFVYAEIWPRSVSHNILTALKPYLDKVTPNSAPELLKEMDYLYRRAIALTPVLSLPHLVKGQFHQAIGEKNKAVECFRAAYEIERDPTRAKWPHLQATEGSARLMLWLGNSLILAGETDEGKKFVRGSDQMTKSLKPAAAPPAPEPE